MNKGILLTIVTLMLLVSVGCSRQTVPPGHLGKLVSGQGYSTEIKKTGKHWVYWWEDLIILDATTELHPEKVSVIMKDYDYVLDEEGKVVSKTSKLGLDMDFVINVRYRIKNDKEILNAMFDDIKVTNKSIGKKAVYAKYASNIVDNVARRLLSQYTPEEVVANYDPISKTLRNNLREELKNGPLEIMEITLGDIQLPKVIKDRIQTNKDRELQLAEEEATQAINMTKKKNEVALATEQAAKDFIDAQSLATQNSELNKSISNEVLELRRLEIKKLEIEMLREAFEKNGDNINKIFIPYGAIDSVGANVSMFNGK